MTPEEKAEMHRVREAQMTPQMKRIREADKLFEKRRTQMKAEEQAKKEAEFRAYLDKELGVPPKKAPEPDIRIEMK